jgi:uncharacterized protein YndB with AHSA1/START domain
MEKTNITKNRETREIVMDRTFDASRDAVWDAWANPEKLAKWWGPRGWETTIKTFEFKPGGTWHYGMKCVDENQGEFYGQTSWGKAVFENIDEPNEFTYKDLFSDEQGNINPDMPAMVIRVTFTEQDGTTRVVSSGVFETVEDFDKVVAMGVEQGAAETWDRWAEFLASEK